MTACREIITRKFQRDYNGSRPLFLYKQSINSEMQLVLQQQYAHHAELNAIFCCFIYNVQVKCSVLLDSGAFS